MADEVDVPLPIPSLPDTIRALGFDPELVRTVVLTSSSVVAIAVDYPEPYVTPQEAS